MYYYKRKIGQVPWGYEICEDDPLLLRPIPSQLDLLKDARDYINKDCPYREVATWLSKKSGRYISHVTLYRALKKKLDRTYLPATTETDAKKISRQRDRKTWQVTKPKHVDKGSSRTGAKRQAKTISADLSK